MRKNIVKRNIDMMEKVSKNIGEQKAITLIALIVTIVILLILASVSIAMLTGENGILNKATTAREKNNEAQEQENITLANYENKINEVVGSRDTVTISKDEYDALKNNQNYSTDEQIVGTWFDGKKIYRKINIINNTLTSNWYSICNIENVDQFISAKLIPKNGQDQNNLFYYNLSYNYPSAGQISVSFIGGNSMVGYAIIEYTKTTDTPSNN